MVFADDERDSNPTSFKFLQMAHEWAQKAKKGGASLSDVLPAPASSRTTNAPEHHDPSANPPSGQGQRDDDSGSDVASSHGGEDDD